MTAKKFYANERKAERIAEVNNRCEVCEKRFPSWQLQIAHRIPATKGYIKKYGKAVIHSERNTAITCPRCNSSVLLDPATHPIEAAELVRQIMEAL